MHGVLRVNLWSPRLVTQQQASRKGGKAVKKGDLPLKVCAVCGLPFTWRKKWEKCWDEVRYCSERCRNQSKRDRGAPEAPG